MRGATTDVLHGSQNKPWQICGIFPAEEGDETDVRQWVDAAVGQCSGLPRPGGVGLNWIGHVAAIVSIMRDQIHCLFWTDNGFVDEWDSSSGKPWLALYLDGTKGRSTTLPARHGW